MKLPVAIQLYSLRDAMSEDFEGTLKKVKEMGYDGVEFAGLYGNLPEDVKSMCENIGLVPISAHVSYDEIMSDPEKVVADYAKIGCKYMALPYAVPERRPGAELFDDTIKGIKLIAGIMKKYSMILLYHNHDFEFENIDGKHGLDVLYEKTTPDELQTQLDVCWVNVGGENPIDYVRKYAGRAPVVHFKDFYKKENGKTGAMYQLIGIDDKDQKADEEENSFEFRPVGYGVQNFPGIIDACHDAGTSWVVVEQDMPSLGKTPIECATLSCAYLKVINK